MCPSEGLMVVPYSSETQAFQVPYVVEVPLPFCGCVVQPLVSEDREELCASPECPSDDSNEGAVIADTNGEEHPPHMAADHDADQNNLDGCGRHQVP